MNSQQSTVLYFVTALTLTSSPTYAQQSAPSPSTSAPSSGTPPPVKAPSLDCLLPTLDEMDHYLDSDTTALHFLMGELYTSQGKRICSLEEATRIYLQDTQRVKDEVQRCLDDAYTQQAVGRSYNPSPECKRLIDEKSESIEKKEKKKGKELPSPGKSPLSPVKKKKSVIG